MPPAVRLTLLALLAAALPTASATAQPAPDPRGLTADDEVIVRFEPGTTKAERAEAREAADVELEQTLELPQAQVVTFDGSMRTALRRLERRKDVAYAQPNYRYEALAPAPTDSFFSLQWGLAGTYGVGALGAWDSSRGNGQVISIVDSGIDLSHPDLVNKLWQNPGEAPGGGDNDGNGHGDDVRGYDFVDNDANPDDYEFHGTHVAGIAGAQADNSIGVAGVAPGASLMAVRALDGNGFGGSAAIANGITYAAQEGADVINLSLGRLANAGDQVVSDALAIARNSDAVVVAAAGNEGRNNDAISYTPCVLPGDHLICVAALRQDGMLAPFSNYGPTTVDVAAPGVGVLSAKTDYSGSLLTEDFEDGLTGWDPYEQQIGAPWGISTQVYMSQPQSAADSPNGWYASNTYTEIHRAAGLNLTGRRGCRMHFELRYEVLPGDSFLAGAYAGDDVVTTGMAGSSGGSFVDASASISEFDGRADTHPLFALKTNATETADGVHLDDLRVFCRDTSYANTLASAGNYTDPGSGNYVPFDGTSMAAPHVSGIAALVRAAYPNASAADVVRAIKTGATPRPGLTGVVVTGGSASAAGALAALAPPSQPPTTVTPPTTRLQVIPVRRAKKRIQLKRSGRFTYTFRTSPRLRGRVVMRTMKKVRLKRGGRRGHLTAVSKPFKSSARGTVTLKIKLSRKALRVIRLNRRVQFRVEVTARNAQGGLVGRGSTRLTLVAPRR